MIVVPDAGNLALMTIIHAAWQVSKPRVHLYINDISPTLSTQLTDLVEAPAPISPPGDLDFLAFPVLDGHNAFLQAAPFLFTMTAAELPPFRLYGLFVTDPTNATLLWAERFARRIYFSRDGQFLNLVVKFGGLSEFTG